MPELAGGNDEEAAPEKQAAEHVGFLERLERRPGLLGAVALATFAAILVGVLAAVPDWREMVAGDDPAPAAGAAISPASAIPSLIPSDGPALSAIDLVVRDPQKTGEPDDLDAPITPPSVEITVHNRGTRRSVTTRIVATVEDSAVIKLCDAQGSTVPVSATYDLVLPPRPAAGTAFQVPVSQQQGPDEADRFALRVGTSKRESPRHLHLYRLRFELVADGQQTKVPAGTAVVTVPETLAEGDGYFWSEAYDSGRIDLSNYPGGANVTACMKANSAVLNRLLSKDAALSPELTEAKAKLRL
ncbi:hypothetical protein ACIBSW_24210 [Actinoplanes sp. NPDC049668]|uniref:hypothetical protein n=1 Tax=unclassified Actinoplanes TaxID=2626549 RepID=UPI00339FC9A2